MLIGGHQVIHVEISAREEFFVIAVTSDREHDRIRLEKCQVKTVPLHPADLDDEFRFEEMGTQLLHHGETASDV